MSKASGTTIQERQSASLQLTVRVWKGRPVAAGSCYRRSGNAVQQHNCLQATPRPLQLAATAAGTAASQQGGVRAAPAGNDAA